MKGTPLGQRNASPDRTRIVVDYSMGLVVGFQPATVRPLLADVTAGTPQRFVFASATDQSIPEESVPWPERAQWFSHYAEDQPWTVDKDVLGEIRVLDLRTARQEITWNPYDAHGTLTRVKIAGLLAALEERKHITEEDWLLAGVAWTTSQAVRESLLAEARTEAAAKEVAGHNRAARRELVIEEARADKARRNAIKAMAMHVSRGACKDGCKRRCVTNAIASRDRQLLDVDEVIKAAIDQKRLQREGDIFRV
jgi:hypothetical protein